MKHLKEYKIFESESNKEVIKTLEEILLDLNDDGYETSIVESPIDLSKGSPNPRIFLAINNSGKKILDLLRSEFGEFYILWYETFNRCIDYMKSEGYIQINERVNDLKPFEDYTTEEFTDFYVKNFIEFSDVYPYDIPVAWQSVSRFFYLCFEKI